VRKPGSEALTLYWPGRRLTSAYAPASLLTTVDTTPVALFVAVIVTPGIKADVGSATVPLTVALLDCPNTGVERARHTSAAVATRDSFMMSSHGHKATEKQ